MWAICEFHSSNSNGFGDIWWTDNPIYFSSIDVIICHFSGRGMVMWTTTHCFYFFACNLMYIVSICAKLQTHTRTNQHSIRPAAQNTFLVIGAIQVLRNADGGGGVSDFLEKSVTKV